MLRAAGPRSALLEEVAGCDRLVLLGDLLELRHGPLRDALEMAEPVLRELGRALKPAAQVVIVPGNHDHRLLRAWLERRGGLDGAVPLGLEADVTWLDGDPLGEVAGWLAPVRVTARYPGTWLRPDVYATHGHYSDRHITVPILERLVAGAMARVVDEPPGGPARAEDYEMTLGPMYAWIDAVAQAGGMRGRGGGGFQVRAWESLQRSAGTGGLLARARRAGVALGFPALVAALNRAGLGPLGADVSGPELRRAALSAFGQVLERLQCRPQYAIFGHTHRAGPLPGDDHAQWRSLDGARLLNSGSWVRAGALLGGDPGRSPYRPGFCVRLDDKGEPELVNLLDPPAPA